MKDWTEVTPPPGEPGERDWGQLAHKVAAEHLDACENAFWCEQGECETESHDGEPGSPTCETPALAPYCSCSTCQVREMVGAVWPVIEAAIRSGDFDSPDDVPAAAGDSPA